MVSGSIRLLVWLSSHFNVNHQKIHELKTKQCTVLAQERCNSSWTDWLPICRCVVPRGCVNNYCTLGGLKWQKSISPQFWGKKSKDKVSAEPCSLWSLEERVLCCLCQPLVVQAFALKRVPVSLRSLPSSLCGSLPSVSLCGFSGLIISSSYKDTSHWI